MFTSPYLDWTVERVAINAKVVGGPHGDKDKMVAVASESSIILWSVPVDALFFIGNQLVATSHTGKVGVWNAVTQHWQVSSARSRRQGDLSETPADRASVSAQESHAVVEFSGTCILGTSLTM